MKAWFDGPVGHGRKVLLLMAAGSLATLAFAAWDFYSVTSVRAEFVSTPCFMDVSVMSKEGGRNERNLPGWNWVPTVQYKYSVHGKEHIGTTICSRTTVINSETAANDFMKTYGPGADAICYVNPADPDDAMLTLPSTSQAQKFGKLGSFALGLAIIGLSALQVMVSFDTRPRKKRPRAPGWGEPDSGGGDPLNRTRQILKERLES